jgi:hypothetical protein
MKEWDRLARDLDSMTYLVLSMGKGFKRGRDVIVRQLSWGSFNAVSLPRDRKWVGQTLNAYTDRTDTVPILLSTNNFVSLKILSSKATTDCAIGESDELNHAR